MNVEEAMSYYARTLPIGQHKKKCPACSTERKNKSDPCLSVKVYGDRIIYNCHHCNMDGIYPFENTITERPVAIESPKVKAVPHNQLTDDAISWLSQRGISKETADQAKLFSTDHWIASEQSVVPCIGYPYLDCGLERGAKIRSLGSKGFSCTNPLRMFFNIDSIEPDDSLIICEGEMDALSFLEAGINSAVSVPNGAVQKLSDGTIDPKEDKTFAFLWEAKDQLDSVSKIIIATDGDSAGETMGRELARRIGRDRCWMVSWPDDCKDANDVLCLYGKEGLQDLIDSAKPWPVSGIYDAVHFFEEVKHMYKHGMEKGLTTGYEELDDYYKVAPGQLTIVTGIPSSGKSEFIDQIMVNQAMMFGIKFAVCSFENYPSLHLQKLLSKHNGKPFTEGATERMDEAELDDSFAFINEHFTFLSYKDGKLVSLDDILERLRIAVLRHGIRGAVIDPYNYIARQYSMSETDWISEMLTKVCAFAKANDVHVWFVAHPTKQQRENGKLPVPKGYDISGSASWFAKADVGLTVHRPNEDKYEAEIHIWKCRFSWVGKQGKCSLDYNPVTTQFNDHAGTEFQDRYANWFKNKDCPF